jgi:secreted trypsin-like serine protease
VRHQESRGGEVSIAGMWGEAAGCQTRSQVSAQTFVIPFNSNRRDYRIVGGGNAGLGSWPWQAALYKEGEFQCGATLLSDTWLVSAGHCFYQ